MRTFLLFFLAMALTAATSLKAQLNVGSTALPDASAVLQATSTNKGVLFPNLTTVQRDAIASPAAGLVVFNTTTNQLEFNAGTAISKNWQPVGGSAIGQLPLVTLTAINAPAPFATNVTGVMVYNTATAGSGAAAVVPGVYVNDGTQWRLVMLMAASFATFTAGTIDCSGALAGTYTVSTAMAATNIKIINITAIGVGAYTASTDTQNGVSFTTSGNITTTGSTAITLTASGTPIAGGTFTYTVSIGGQNCTFSVTYVYPPATFGTGTIDCSGTLAGTYNSSIAMTAANTKTINITITTAGTYTASTDTQNGVSFTALGTATTTGATAITFIASGTPTAAGTFIYNATIAGQTCFFLVTYTTLPATYTAGTLSCIGTPAGTYAPYAPMTASNTKTVTIGVATAGTYTATTDTQNGVVFSGSGTFANAGGGPPKSIILTASGTPTASGTFTYTITMGGQTCTFGVTYTPTSATFVANSIDCSGALAGAYTVGAPMTVANTKTVNIGVTNVGVYYAYSAAVNGVTFSAPTINSTSVVTATGTNAIAFIANGTPLASGTFNYNVNFGGGPSGQICSFTVTYLAPPATFTPNSIDCSGSLAGNYYPFIPMAAANTKTISIEVATAGAYTASTDIQNGVSFLGSVATTATGTSTVALVASGTPITGGTFTYTATIGGQTCTFPVNYSAAATFAPGTIDCSGTLAGTYSYLPLTASNTKIINITNTAVGSYTASTDTQNGVTFTTSGVITSTGSTAITLVASGTPPANGTFTYTVTIAGQTCTFPVTYTFVEPTFAAGSMDCGGPPVGTYTVGVPMNASNIKTTTITVLTPGSLHNIFTAGQSPTTNTGLYFLPTQTLSTTGNTTITWAASGTPLVSGTYPVNIILGGQNCSFNVTIAPAVASFTAGTIDCSGTLSGTYTANQSMSPLNKKTININAAGIGSYSATTDTKNGVTFLSSGSITATGSNAIQFGAGGTPIAGGTFTYTATIGGQTCTFDVTYLGLATYSSINCSGTLAGVYNTGVAMTAANTKTLQAFALTAGVYTAATPTINGVKFAVTGTQATGNALATYSLVATGTPTAAGTFSYKVVIGNQNCSFNVVYTTPTPVATVGSIDCTGTLAGSYNTGVAMAGTNTKIINITSSSIGSYNATTDMQNGVNFSAIGIITAIGVKSVTLVGTGTPAAAGTFTYTVTVAGQTCQFTVVFTTDALRTSLSAAGCASCSAYDAAAANTWVPITAAEYDATALATNITDAGIYGTSEADMVSGAGAFPNSGTNETCTPFSLPTVANTYIYGLSMEVIGSGAGQGFQVKAVPVSAPTDVITDYPATGALANITSTISTRTRLYFVLKQPTTVLVPVSYIGGYDPNGMNLSFGYPAGGGVNSRYVGTGNVTTAMFANPGNYRVQLLGTVTKQW